jgi:UDP-glucose 4-epimerase
MAKSIVSHVDFAVGYKPQTITFIYVKDLVRAVYLAVGSDVVNRCYFISEPCGYSSRAFSDCIQKELGIKRVLHIKAPVWFLWVVSACAGWVSRLRGKPGTLNSDKYKIMKQRNWLCDTLPAETELGFKAEYTLAAGTKETIEWYKEEKWL